MNGVIISRNNGKVYYSEDLEPLVAFLTRKWDYENSPYIREKLDYGHAITRRHAHDQSQWNAPSSIGTSY